MLNAVQHTLLIQQQIRPDRFLSHPTSAKYDPDKTQTLLESI